MSIAKILRIIRRFYFNYHYYDMPSDFSMTAFSRRAQYSIRMTVSFLFAGFLAYSTTLNNQLSLEYLIPVLSILLIQETIGMTLLLAYQMFKAIVPLSIFLYIVHIIGLKYRHYLAAELLLLISSLAIGYKCSQVQTRKLVLLINALFFTTVVNQQNLPTTFIFVLLQQFAIGAAVTLAVSLVIFPFFATIDFENRIVYSLKSLHKMQHMLIQAFLSHDHMGAQVALARTTTIEQMVREAMNSLTSRIVEARLEPSQVLQRIYNRKRKHLMNLTMQEQENFISSLMFHVCSLEIMIQQCKFNEYHLHFKRELQESLLHLDLCQSTVISSLTHSKPTSREQFDGCLFEYEQAYRSVRQAYIEARFHRVEHVLETGTTINSDDHLSHAFFLFQLGAIVRLVVQATTFRPNKTIFQQIKEYIRNKRTKKRRTFKEYIKPQWPRFVSAFKSMIIIGVGSIFVMVPRLAHAFENGQWILIALCMTQGDTVGGAFTTMKMRLVGTLLGAMWAYITYLSVNDHVYSTFGMLIPWVLIFGYLKLLPNWGYAATVAAFTPVLINLGRLPYGNALPAGNYALLRIEENLVGIAIAIILTIIIFPVFAIDILKNNIQSTIQVCRQSIDSMHSIYDKLFHCKHLDMATGIELEDKNAQEIKSFVDAQRNRFHQLISSQRLLVEHAALEPTMWWFRNHFSAVRYQNLVSQQVDIFRMLHNIDAILIRIDTVIEHDESQIKHLQTNAAGGFFLPDIHSELSSLSQQLSDCFRLWASYFKLTQTRSYRIVRECTFNGIHLNKSDLLKHEQHLIELHQTIHRLQDQHQQACNNLLQHYLDRITEGDSPSNFIPYLANEKADLIFIGISAMYYSTTHLARSALALGINIHTLFELETTSLYQSY